MRAATYGSQPGSFLRLCLSDIRGHFGADLLDQIVADERPWTRGPDLPNIHNGTEPATATGPTLSDRGEVSLWDVVTRGEDVKVGRSAFLYLDHGGVLSQ